MLLIIFLVSGVGEKTAQKLIQEFGSIENLLQNTDKLKGKLRENIENNAEKGLLSKRLARIILDVPVTFHKENFALSSPKMEEIIPIFEELEFRTMLGTLQKAFQQVNTSNTEYNFIQHF